MAFKVYEGKRDAAKKITDESKKIEKLFRKLATATLEPEKKCSVLPTLRQCWLWKSPYVETNFCCIISSTKEQVCTVAFI